MGEINEKTRTNDRLNINKKNEITIIYRTKNEHIKDKNKIKIFGEEL